MKIAATLKFLKLVILSAVIAVGFRSGTAYAGETNIFDLVLTENSSTSLSLSYNGLAGPAAFTILNTSPDHWSIQVINSDVEFSDFSYDWQEPEEANEINEVSHFRPNFQPSGPVQGDFLFVTSDLNLLMDSGGPVLPNNTAAPLFVGFEDSSQFGNIRLTFNDLAQLSEGGPTVPDKGSTLGLLGLAVAGLLGASRIRFARMA
jgi:hypothetical protein